MIVTTLTVTITALMEVTTDVMIPVIMAGFMMATTSRFSVRRKAPNGRVFHFSNRF